MSSYKEKYQLHKVEPVRSRNKLQSSPVIENNHFKPKMQKTNSVKIQYKPKAMLHKAYSQPEQAKPPIYIPKTEQLLRSAQSYKGEHQKKKDFFRRKTAEQKEDEVQTARSQISLTFKSSKDISAGNKIISSIQGFITKILKPGNGCTCGQPCPHSQVYWQWVGVSDSTVKNHYFDMLHQYEQFLQKGDNIQSRCSIEDSLPNKPHSASLYEQLKKTTVQIQKDIDRTQSECPTFQNPIFRQKLRNILVCYGYQDPQVGYIQGMNMVLSGLLFHIKDQVKTYAVFRKLIFAVRSIYFDGFQECYEHINKIRHYLKIHVNDLYTVFEEQSVDLNMVCLPWVLSLLTCLVPLAHLHMVYNGFILDSWRFFYRASLAIMTYHKDRIINNLDASEILLLFSPTNQKKLEYDWEGILHFADSIKL